MNTAYIGLGANLGDPTATIRAALITLSNLQDSKLQNVSSLYRTAPIGINNQPDFINAVAKLDTKLSPEVLLDLLQEIEIKNGRIRFVQNGPRTLDLDILLYNNLEIALPRLTLPHPRLHLRAFVLHPLAEIAPNINLPGKGPLMARLPYVANQVISRL